MKKQLLIIFLAASVLLAAIPFNVQASWTTPSTYVDVEDVGWFNNDQNGVDSFNNQVFWEEDLDRWYILYSEDLSSHDYKMRYSYSDSGDISTWNNGGTINTDYLRTISHAGTPVNSQFAWAYDNENDLGHIAWGEDYSAGGTYGVFYKNFTMNPSTGVITFGDTVGLSEQSSGNAFFSLDVAVSPSGLPIVAAGSYYTLEGAGSGLYMAAWQCDEIDGYGGNWECVYFQPGHGYGSPVIIPTGNTSILLIALDAQDDNPADYFEIQFGVTSNSSGTGDGDITDGNLGVYNYLGSVEGVHGFGVSWNTTHGFISYTDDNQDAQAFVFDFLTLTKSDEYEYAAHGTYYQSFTGMTVHNNEGFATCKYDAYTFTTSHNQSFAACEFHDPSYDGYWNISATDFILEGYMTTWSQYNPKGANTAKTPDDDGNCLMMITHGDYVAVTWFNVEGEYPTSEDYFTLTADLEDVDDDGADWVYTDWKYYNFSFETNMQPENVSIFFTVPTGEEDITGGFWSDGDEWIYESNMTYESREGEPMLLQAGSWSFNASGGNLTLGSFLIWFEGRILDVWESSEAISVYYSLDAGYPYLDSGLDFRIYSKGGFTLNYAAEGDAGILDGGSAFSFYGNNGSIVYNEIWYRDAQHVKLLPEVHFLTGLDPFYLRYGCDFSLGDGEWIEGWSVYINPKVVAYTGWLAANTWINYTNIWNNAGEAVLYDDMYSFYHGSVSGEGDPGWFKMWVDLWFSDKNASSVAAGRINAYEYPMIDSADLWLRWLANNWGVKDDVLKELSMYAPLLDGDGDLISSEKISMMRFWCELEVDDADGGQYITIENYEAFDITHSRELPLVGVSDPVFDETLIPTVNQKGILGALWSMFAGLGSWLSENVIFGGLNLWGTFVDFLDTIAAWLGAPKFFTNLFTWIGESVGYLGDAFTYLIDIVADVWDLFASLLGAFLDTMGQLIQSIVNFVTMFTDMMGGAYGAGVDIWETLGISTWITVALIFYPLYLVILWEERGMDAVIQQLTWIFGILSWIFDFMSGVIREAIMLITSLIESIPVAE